MQIDKRSRKELKQYFVKNAIPTESNFAELVDGMLSQRDDGIAKLPNDPLSIEAVGDDASQKKVLQLYRSFTDPAPSWVLSLNPRQDPADPSSARACLGIGDSPSTTRLFIEQGTGDVGIGTMPAGVKLRVAGSAVFEERVQANTLTAVGEAGVLDLEGRDHVYIQWYPMTRSSGRKGWMGYGNPNDLTMGISNDAGDLHLYAKLVHVFGDLESEGSVGLGWARSIDDLDAPLRSGLYQSRDRNDPGRPPDLDHDWCHLLTVRHSNPTNHHQLQIASTYAENDRLFFRKIARQLDDISRPVWNEVATVTRGVLKVGEWTLESAGETLFIKRGAAVVACFSTSRDRFNVFQDINGAKPYYFFNMEGDFGTFR